MSIPADTLRLLAAAPRRSLLQRLRLGDYPLVPLAILAIIAILAVFANQLAPHNPEVGTLAHRFRPPVWCKGGSMQYLLGTDQLGRDVLSRLIFGARISMVVGFTAVVFAGTVGTLLGKIGRASCRERV